MGLFDFFKKKKTADGAVPGSSYFDISMDDDSLKACIHHALTVFQNMPGAAPEDIVKAIRAQTEDGKLAEALYRFIPIAGCRIFLPEVTYSDEYIVYADGDHQRSYSFSGDRIYKAVLAVTRTRLPAMDPMPLLFHSSEFKAINDLLHKGSKLENIVGSPTYFV